MKRKQCVKSRFELFQKSQLGIGFTLCGICVGVSWRHSGIGQLTGIAVDALQERDFRLRERIDLGCVFGT